MFMRSRAVPVLFVCVILGAMFWHVPAASAQTEYVDVPAAGFPLVASSTFLGNSGVVEVSAAEVLRAAVRLKPALRLCQLKFWAHDFDSNDVTLRLMRKNTGVTGTFGPPPEVVASVSSAGAVDALRAFSTTTFTDDFIGAGYFYWVELDFEGGPIQVSGVRIRTAPTC